jgi:hypothetical protein
MNSRRGPACADDRADVVGCKHFPGTLLAVNRHSGCATTGPDFPISWSSFHTGATIGKGTVALGVNADGNLGRCSHGLSRSCCEGTSDILDLGPALVLNVTSLDAIRGEAGSAPGRVRLRAGPWPTRTRSSTTIRPPGPNPGWTTWDPDYDPGSIRSARRTATVRLRLPRVQRLCLRHARRRIVDSFARQSAVLDGLRVRRRH